MAGKQLTPMSQVKDYLEKEIKQREDVLVQITLFAGEAGLRVARINGNYKDRTGNLRASTGYAVIKDGRVQNTGTLTSEMSQGQMESQEFIKQLSRQFPRTLTLVEVAGMNYARYVAAKGYDVLDSSERETRQTFKRLLKQAGYIVK